MSEPAVMVNAHPAVPQKAVAQGHKIQSESDLSSKFKDEVRTKFRSFLTTAYWDTIHTYMLEAGWPVKDAATRVGINATTVGRWERETNIGFESICLMFAGCDLRLQDVPFPLPQVAYKSALFSTITAIRSTLVKDDSRLLDDPQWYCLCQGLANFAEVREILSVPDGTPMTDRVREVCESIAEKVHSRYPSAGISNAHAVLTVFTDWMKPLLLFYTVIPPARREN